MPITITPTIADITINATTWTHDDWEANTPGTISAIGNAINSQLVALGETTGSLVKAITGDTTLSGPEAVNLAFIFTGALGANAAITFPAGEREAVIVNETTGGHALTVGLAAGATATIPAGGSATVYCDGTDFGLADGIARTATGASVTGTFAASGATTLSSTLSVGGTASITGNTTIGGTLTVDGATAITDNVTVTGNTTLTGVATINGSLVIAADIEANSGAVFNGELDINGTVRISEDVYGRNMSATNNSGSVAFHIDSAEGTTAGLTIYTAAAARWFFGKTAESEDGSDTGSNFALSRVSDAGFSTLVLQVNRESGEITLTLPTVAGSSGTLWNDGGIVKVVA